MRRVHVSQQIDLVDERRAILSAQTNSVGGLGYKLGVIAQPLDCTHRGDRVGVSATAVFSALPGEIGERMLTRARRDLVDWPEEAFRLHQVPADQGPGVILLLEACYANVTEVVSAFGQLGVTAERLAKTSAARMQGYAEASAFAGPYLADQLLLPFVLASGGAFTTVKPSQHLLTAIDIAETFTGQRIDIAKEGRDHLISIG